MMLVFHRDVVFEVDESNLQEQLRLATRMASDPNSKWTFLDAAIACDKMRAAVYQYENVYYVFTATRYYPDEDTVTLPCVMAIARGECKYDSLMSACAGLRSTFPVSWSCRCRVVSQEYYFELKRKDDEIQQLLLHAR